ncbi:MAG: hypothetical protein Q8O92_11915 [Candidatus Latescibacter sp.]|nr:hypothetical protein [Candidatus Latescibacter sp.]
MQKVSAIFTGVLAIVMVAGVAMFVGCQRDQGAIGLTGPAGSDGVAKCGTCHNVSTEVLAKQIQWSASVHATGGHFRSNSTACASCHTNEGFRATMDSGNMVAAPALIDNPTPPNCRTCHNIHQKYDLTDFVNSTTKPVKLMVSSTGATTNFDKGNLCANCHQPRLSKVTPYPTLNGDDLTIVANWGAQMASQAVILRGVGSGAFEIPGSVAYINSSHSTLVPNRCITCHMAPVRGDTAGGHTWKMTYLSSDGITENNYVAGCVACHTGLTSGVGKFDVNKVQTDVEGLIAQLKALLVTAKMLDTTTDRGLAGTFPSNKVGILMNYKLIEAEGSHGVHNPLFVKALLKNSIDYMKK